MARLLSIFSDVTPPPANASAFAVKKLTAGSRVWVGKDNAARPVVLIETSPGGATAYGVSLRNIHFDPWVECRITDEGRDPRSIMASVIRCVATERELHEHFLRALSPACEELGPAPRVADVESLVLRLVEVFRALAQPSQASIQGLWAELLLLSQSDDIDLAVTAWQPRARSLVDFVHGPDSVEVKSCVGPIRRHHFKLAQLRAPATERRYVASILLTEDPRGATISDLWDIIEQRLGNRRLLRDRTAAVVAGTLGDDWQRVHSYKYQLTAACVDALLFDVCRIPRVGEDAVASITDIEFQVDLSGVEPFGRELITLGGRLIQSFIKRLPAYAGA